MEFFQWKGQYVLNISGFLCLVDTAALKSLVFTSHLVRVRPSREWGWVEKKKSENDEGLMKLPKSKAKSKQAPAVS